MGEKRAAKWSRKVVTPIEEGAIGGGKLDKKTLQSRGGVELNLKRKVVKGRGGGSREKKARTTQGQKSQGKQKTTTGLTGRWVKVIWRSNERAERGRVQQGRRKRQNWV